jgi:3-phosphoshikimate 1-carboxyvinyltransferase
MEVTINKADLSGTVSAIASKSFAHRLLICAALSETETQIACPERSDDIDATVSCLNALGARISRTEKGFFVLPIPRRSPNRGAKLGCRESGSTLRFLLPVSCALGANAVFFPEGRLPKRPLSPLYEEQCAHGCTLSPQGTVPFQSSGQLKGGHFTLRGDISSQYISGLLFALPLLKEDSVLTLTGALESKSYLDMTRLALRDFGIEIHAEQNDMLLSIQGNQTYRAPGEAQVEADWSNAAFWLCAGALSPQGVTVTGLKPGSLQGDSAVTDLLKRFGAHVKADNRSVSVSRGSLRGIEIDAQNIPDLVPALSAVAAAAEGTTVFKNAQRLRLKESDRLQAVSDTLTALGAEVSITNDGLIIQGKRSTDRRQYGLLWRPQDCHDGRGFVHSVRKGSHDYTRGGSQQILSGFFPGF